jgi:hypothetical protein
MGSVVLYAGTTEARLLESAYTSPNDFFGSPIEVKRLTKVRVEISVSTAAKLQAFNGTTALVFNNDTALTANCLYVFEMMMHPSDDWDFRLDTNCTIRYFLASGIEDEK